MTNCKEDEDYVLFSTELWNYLHQMYGGFNIRRESIELTADDESKKKEYMVEIFY